MMNNNIDNYIRVKEAKPRDSGRGIARLDPDIAEKHGLQPGDILLIEGNKRTGCIVWPGYPDDLGSGIIRIDGTIRKNAGVGIDDKVEIKKSSAKKIEKLILSPTEELKIVGGEEYLSQILEGRVVTRGDIIELNLMGRKVDF